LPFAVKESSRARRENLENMPPCLGGGDHGINVT
jgi:hypothetical protein